MHRFPISHTLFTSSYGNQFVEETRNGGLNSKSIRKCRKSQRFIHSTKNTLLKPATPFSGYSVPIPLLDNTPTPTPKRFYKCGQCSSFVTEDPTATCPGCRLKMVTGVAYVGINNTPSASNGGGFVKGVVTYMVMDDLVVTPMSAISSIALLNKLNVQDVSGLEEKIVNFGMDEAVKLLKSSLQSKRVLTDVFLEDGCELKVEETNAGSSD